jgi:glucose-1-phosphate cytidylyltransferase
VKPLSRFGVIEVGADGQVEAFKEKPQMVDSVNGGFFVFEPRIFNYLNIESILEQEPLKQLAEEGELMAFQHEGFWQPMDTFREYTILNQMWNSNNATWKRW